MASRGVHKMLKSDGHPFTVLIEGNIGSGKTTFLNHFRQHDGVCLQTEPVDKWRNVGGVNLLERMYKEPDRWAMPFQNYVTLTMLQTHTMATEKSVKLMERSIFSARNCFVENMRANGVLHGAMYEIMQELYKYFEDNVHIQTDLIVYLRTTPEVVYERMKTRARSEEDCVPLEYLKQLHELHENWLIHGAYHRPAPVLVLDADLNMDDIASEYRRSESSILKPMLIDNVNQQTVTPPIQRKPSEKLCSFLEEHLQTTMASSVHKMLKSDGHPFTVFVEGNIGSGKSTFLNHFKQHDGVCLQREPVDKWRNVGGVNLLDRMYKEPDRWAMPFQTYATLTMLQTHTMATDKSVKLMERSIYSGRYCFVENMRASGILHSAMYDILQEWYHYIEQNVHIQADLIVYLRTTPKVVYERMKTRARSEEECVPYEYLEQLHELHENWLIHGAYQRPAPVLVLDANLNRDAIGSEYRRSESSILRPMQIDNRNQQLLTSPIKRKHSDY